MSYSDGAKVYFKNGGWVIARFSGTEPLLRIFCEMEDKAQAEYVLQQMKTSCLYRLCVLVFLPYIGLSHLSIQVNSKKLPIGEEHFAR